MILSSRHLIITCILLCFLNACATLNSRKIANTRILHAQQAIPEEKLLDVGIAVFKSPEITEKKAKKEGTSPEVRKAENHFIPYHLKNTLEQSGYWGMVRVTPLKSESADVLVNGEIIESNGENLTLKVTVSDSSGKVWFRKKYKATLKGDAYDSPIPVQKDACQGLYNAISNDMANYMKKLRPEYIREIRTISKLKFAQDFAPQAFENHVREDKKGTYTLNRLPADNDPMMTRISKIREREYMFEDTINEYYEGFYDAMWSPYVDWRMLNLTERLALAEQKRSAFLRKAGGALLIVVAILMQLEGVHDSTLLTAGLVIVGGQVFLSGMNISKQAKMHYEAIEELSESFGSEMEPVVVELEGKKYKLTGSAEEQYARWRALLREIYYTETGFTPPDISDRKNLQ